METTRGTGNGGQHKNSTDSCVIMTHIPTGIKVVRDGRSQLTNRDDAYKEIKKRYKPGYELCKLCPRALPVLEYAGSKLLEMYREGLKRRR